MPPLPPWAQLKQQMIQAGEKPEAIQAAFEEYQSMMDPNPNVTVSPAANQKPEFQPNQPVVSLQSASRTGPTFEAFNPALEESKKALEPVAQARALFDQLDVVKKAADRLIPAADIIQIDLPGPLPKVESGFMGSVRGLQRDLGNKPFIRTEERGLRPWEQYSSGVMSILARGLGEKGVLTEGDISRIGKLLPRPDDTSVSREENFNLLKEFVKSRIDSYEKRLKEASYAAA